MILLGANYVESSKVKTYHRMKNGHINDERLLPETYVMGNSLYIMNKECHKEQQSSYKILCHGDKLVKQTYFDNDCQRKDTIISYYLEKEKYNCDPMPLNTLYFIYHSWGSIDVYEAGICSSNLYQSSMYQCEKNGQWTKFFFDKPNCPQGTGKPGLTIPEDENTKINCPILNQSPDQSAGFTVSLDVWKALMIISICLLFIYF